MGLLEALQSQTPLPERPPAERLAIQRRLACHSVPRKHRRCPKRQSQQPPGDEADPDPDPDPDAAAVQAAEHLIAVHTKSLGRKLAVISSMMGPLLRVFLGEGRNERGGLARR